MLTEPSGYLHARLPRAVLVLALLLGLMLGAVQPTLAQGDLTEQYTTPDGALTVRHPAGWVIEDQGPSAFAIASSEEAQEASNSGEPLPAGGVSINFALPAALSEVGLATDVEPLAALERIIELFQAEGTAELYPGLSVPAARATVSGEDLPGGEAVLYALAFPAGTVLIAAAYGPGDKDADPLALTEAIIATVEYTGAALPPAPGETLRQWAIEATGSSQYGTSGWSFSQATGEPNTDRCGDVATAWASSSSTGEDFLELTYAVPVIPTQVNIYQTYNPGSIVRVALVTEDGENIFVPDSADPPGNTPCPGIFTLDITGVTTPVIGVIIYLDQRIGGNWNEIDAVELVGTTVGGTVEPPSGGALDFNLPPVAGSTTLQAGFTPDPFSVTVSAGGPANATSLGTDADNNFCYGYMTAAPTYSLNWSGTGTFLRFYVQSSGDTVMVVNAPNGSWYCNDDTFGLNPAISFDNPAAGRYDVWIGTFSTLAGMVSADLFITELRSDPSSTDRPGTGGQLDFSLPPNYGSTTLQAGFTPDPFSVQLTTGGPVDASYLGMAANGLSCWGYVTSAPDYSLTWSGTSSFLRFYVESERDSTLIINAPDGSWYCNDDAFGLMPALDFTNPPTGRYDIWVGSFSPGGGSAGRLFITELRSNQPR